MTAPGRHERDPVHGDLGNEAGIAERGFKTDVVQLIRSEACGRMEEKMLQRMRRRRKEINPSANPLQKTRLDSTGKDNGQMLTISHYSCEICCGKEKVILIC
jgi:hypothetical protein